MLVAPTSEAKTETTQSRSQAQPTPERVLHPPAIAASSAYSFPGATSGAAVRPSQGQTSQALHGLQSAYGNQAILRTLHSPQHVARMPTLRPSQSMILQRQCACGGSSETEGECAECKAKREGVLQRSVGHQATPPAAPTVPPIVHDVLRSPGQPLDAGTRAFMEPCFGHDFSQVRIHTDASAAESARAVNALAYTVGRNVVFGSGQYAPKTDDGKRLIAHELTHVVQQSTATPSNKLQLAESDTGYEQEATQMADMLLRRDRPLTYTQLRAPAQIYRQIDWQDNGKEQMATSEQVDVIHVSCEGNFIDFHTNTTVYTYTLTTCDVSDADYISSVTVTGNNVQFDAPPGSPSDTATFQYRIEPNQPNPATLLAQQNTVRIVVGPMLPLSPPSSTTSTPAPRYAQVCARPLDVRYLGRFFNHAFISDTPYIYAIRFLAAGNGVTTSCSYKLDASPPPDVPATSTCKPCLPKPGQTIVDVSSCLRNTYLAYANPNLYRNLPDPSDSFKHGPNSNSFAAAMATCCLDSSPAGLGRVPGWRHRPADPCPIPLSGPSTPGTETDTEGTDVGQPDAGIRDAGVPLPGGVQEQGTGSSGGSTVVPTDLHAFGPKSNPRAPREGKDIDVDPGDRTVGPTDPPTGASTFGDVNEAPLTGHYHRLDQGTQLLEGIKVIADGSDVGGPHGKTHHTIFPGRRMPFDEFVQKFLLLGWRYIGKK